MLETECNFNWGFGDYHADGSLDHSVANQPSSPGVHEYTGAGVFAVHVTVVCDGITFVSSSASVQVDEPAGEAVTMAIGTPGNNDLFVAGSTIMLTVDAGDSASNLDREVEWHLELQHSGHTHPITRLTGHAVSFSVPTQGHGFPDDSRKAHMEFVDPHPPPPPARRFRPPNTWVSFPSSCRHLGALSSRAVGMCSNVSNAFMSCASSSLPPPKWHRPRHLPG